VKTIRAVRRQPTMDTLVSRGGTLEACMDDTEDEKNFNRPCAVTMGYQPAAPL